MALPGRAASPLRPTHVSPDRILGVAGLAEAPHTTWHMSDEELVEWAGNIDIPTPGELDGSEPIDDPPAGFPTWDDWRRHRWPPSVS